MPPPQALIEAGGAWVAWPKATSCRATGPWPSQRLRPPLPPADAVLQFEVELLGLSRAGYWQRLVSDLLPPLCVGLVPLLLGLVGFHLYRKASSPRISKKKLKEEKRNKAKKK